MWLVVKMIQARAHGTRHKHDEVVVSTSSEQSTMESIVSAQRGLQSLHELIKTTNITLLKLQSIYASRTRRVRTLFFHIPCIKLGGNKMVDIYFFLLRGLQHADIVMLVLTAMAVLLAMIPLKFIFLGTIAYCFVMSSSLGKYMENDRGNRRWKEWWHSIPVVPVRVDDKDK